MARVGEIIDGKYEVLKEIGRGGMSIVYLAMDKRLNKQWAIKEYRQDAQFHQLAKESLIKEAQLMKNLDHPRLPRIVDIIDNGSTVYIIMDYIEGEPLNKVLDVYGAQPQEAVIEWGKQLAEVLDYLHSRSPMVVYRDMKPANIMLKPDGSICLFDFGIAKEIEDDVDGGTTVGTRGYAAPEQFSRGAKIDGRTDIYALGVTLYHLATGKNPAEPPYELYPIRHWNLMLSSALEWLIQKCTQLNPGDRYQSCAEVTYVLENLGNFETEYKSKQKMKLNVFIAMVALTFVFALVGTLGLVMKNYTRNADIATYMSLGIDGYQSAIERDNTYAPAYMALVDAYFDQYGSSDTRFKDSTEMIAAFSSDNLEKLKSSDLESYVNVCFKLGNLYWIYYDGGNDLTNMIAARGYFIKALEADTQILKPDEKQQAELYAMLTDYSGKDAIDTMNGDATTPTTDRDGNEMTAKTYWEINNKMLDSLKDVNAEKANLTNIVKLTALKRIAYVAQESFGLFTNSNNGITKKDMQIFYDKAKAANDSIKPNPQTKSAELQIQVNKYLSQLDRLIGGLKDKE